MNHPAAIELDSLTRRYHTPRGEVVALDDVSLTVTPGQIVAVLGENGAGKTTLAKILSTLLHPSAGAARVFGHDVVTDARRARALTTAVFGGDRGLYPMLSGRENLRYFGVVHGVASRELRRQMPRLLEEAGLTEAANRRVETYSKGMRQRLHLCIGLLTRPRVLLLDEPTVGLDPKESARLRETIAEFPSEGTTVLLTSHNLLDVERLAERVVMLSSGRISHDLPLDEFRRLAGHDAVVKLRLPAGARLTPELEALGADIQTGGDGTVITLSIRRWSPAVLGEISAALRGQNILDLDVRPATLDEAFANAAEGRWR
ncbi:ABC transporter ATP-binding protein [Nesterenkonia muleiensis]|uniref:ABC transporter ATP-binding protein n=1 Tax=Nesterenkonia muleiensis TaxID=2282648 RepID=UPI000E70A1FE|nr:ABC transporter ATP-binding protein [Nesterenkonia muleiensis]